MQAVANQKILAVIPARFASTRFPGKVVASLCGKPLVLHVYERACQARLVNEAVIATDDQRVVDALAPFDAKVVMTAPDHPAGTDRVAEVAAGSDADIVVNVQGDEPLIDPAAIDAAIQALLDNPETAMSTARRRITTPDEIIDPNVVKVVCDQRGMALYFSRHPIPYVRDAGDAGEHWQHLGLYAYRRDFLLKFTRLPQTPLERSEKLEQLRALENGYAIAVVETAYNSVGVDTPEDLERVRTIMEERTINA